MRYFLLVILLLMVQQVYSQVTIHILSPWRNDTTCTGHRDSLRMVGNDEVGYSPGTNMTSEGGGWFYYTYKQLQTGSYAAVISFKICTWCGPTSSDGSVSYSTNFRLDSLLAGFPPATKELWVNVTDTNQKPQVFDRPPGGKVLYLLNPWPKNSPQMIVGDRTPIQMQPQLDLFGWYTGYYVGPADSLWNVKFTDYFHTQQYTSMGLTNGSGIDLRSVLSTSDTVYILPKSFPSGIPELSATFPGVTGDCSFRKVSAHFRDWILDDKSFFNDPRYARSGGVGMVQKTLTAPDWKPKVDPASTTLDIPPLETWYTTIAFPDGTSNYTCNELTIVKNSDGRWTFDSDKMGGFFPLDNFNNPNNVKYLDEHSVMHNFHFTMEMHLQFIYHAGTGQDFAVIGDDDIFVYINNKLAIDLGGLNYYAADTLYLDKESVALQLVDGEVYNLDLFYAEREPFSSNLIITTSMELQNSGTQIIIKKPQPLSIKPFEPAGLIIPMKPISGKYYSITGRKLARKLFSTQPLIREQLQK